MNIRQVLKEGKEFLRFHGVPFFDREALYLLQDILGDSSLSASLLNDISLDEDIVKRYIKLLERRSRREPIPYINETISFYGIDLVVEKGVLIPRQETELLAERVHCFFKKNNITSGILWDWCCGSGCLGLSLKKVMPDLTVSLFDISRKAVQVASLNAVRQSVQVTVETVDVLNFPDTFGKCDYLVCNPPYLSFKEILATDLEVRCYEPWRALYGGEKGLLFYSFIAENLHRFLNPYGKLWLEIGSEQGQVIKSLFEKQGYQGLLFSDFSGKDRFFFLEADR